MKLMDSQFVLFANQEPTALIPLPQLQGLVPKHRRVLIVRQVGTALMEEIMSILAWESGLYQMLCTYSEAVHKVTNS